jgi:hypothetical protein
MCVVLERNTVTAKLRFSTGRTNADSSSNTINLPKVLLSISVCRWTNECVTLSSTTMGGHVPCFRAERYLCVAIFCGKRGPHTSPEPLGSKTSTLKNCRPPRFSLFVRTLPSEYILDAINAHFLLWIRWFRHRQPLRAYTLIAPPLDFFVVYGNGSNQWSRWMLSRLTQIHVVRKRPNGILQWK